MNTEKLTEMFYKYNLVKDTDVFKHQHFAILTRSGIEKIQAQEKIEVKFEVVKCETNFAGVKAIATKDDKTIETYGSALKGEGFKDGNCNTHYVLEMAEKRALARSILKLLNLYEINVKSEDEAEDFKKSNNQ
tara:strand:- start:147 stop:545 length:399 start_codon:yes stop_codon:yes gene_type:complete